MAYSFKKKENIGNKNTEYSRYYSAFRGVDFTSDHTQVLDNRLAYLVNMYKDYKSGQGEALETIAGFRKNAIFDTTQIYGVHAYKYRDAYGKEKQAVLVHNGKKLYEWVGFPYTIGVELSKTVQLPKPNDTDTGKSFVVEIDFVCSNVSKVVDVYGNDIQTYYSYHYDQNQKTLTINSSTNSSTLKEGDYVTITYKEKSMYEIAVYSNMNQHKSVSFICNNKLYILDGKGYYTYDGNAKAGEVGFTVVSNEAYIPTTRGWIIPSGENKDNGIEYEQRNMLTSKFRNTFIADGTTKTFQLSENDLESIESVKVYGEEVKDYTASTISGTVTLTTAPTASQDTDTIEVLEDGKTVKYERGHAGVEIVASKKWKTIDGVTMVDDIAELITGCTLCTTYDGRVFFTGNPKMPNHIFYCGRNSTGYVDPTYFGVLNYMQDGVGIAPITGIMSVSDTLMVLKADTQQDSSVYFHTGTDTGIHLLPRIYPSKQGLSGLGCLGACINFRDDPVFVSRLGLEAVSHLNISSERTNEHRSSLVDAKLVNTDLANAQLAEWDGYLCLLVDGKIFLADSRQRYADSMGAMQYEWYYLEGIGVYEEQYQEYTYSRTIASELNDKKVTVVTDDGNIEYEIELAKEDLRGTTANLKDAEGKSPTVYSEVLTVDIDGTNFFMQVYYTLVADEDGKQHAYLCETKGNYIGGTFKKATSICTINDNLYFGCENGVVCAFNFDMRNEYGELPPQAYHFDNRTILSGCATKMDNCQIPHLTKSTIKRSTVIKTKSFVNSTAKVKVRTNKKPYEQIARINSGLFTFEDMDFSDFSFATTDQSVFAIKETEKQWVEKQYYIYSDEYMKPFSLFYVAYRYKVAGRIKY